jgi:hypothetical protein
MVTWDGKVGSDSDFSWDYVGKTIPPNNNFYRSYGYHSQMGGLLVLCLR